MSSRKSRLRRAGKRLVLSKQTRKLAEERLKFCQKRGARLQGLASDGAQGASAR